MSSRVELYCDLDGVIIDFVRPAMERHNAGIKDLSAYPTEFKWDLVAAVNEIRWRRGYEVITGLHFWESFDYDFWRSLPKYPFATWFFNELMKMGSVRFATAPTLRSDCVAGKFDWVREHFPTMLRQTYIGADKTAYVKPGVILIDDRDKNVEDFIAAGGKAVLVPRPWNKGWSLDHAVSQHSTIFSQVLKAISELI